MLRTVRFSLVTALIAGAPVAMADVHDFPSSDSTVVGSTGFINDSEIGYFWSATRGDSVEERFADPQASIGSARWDFDIVTNTLREPLLWVMVINGEEVGKLEVNPGDIGPQSVEFDFASVAAISGSYTVRVEARNDISPGAGSHTLRYALAGPHQITLGDSGGPACYADCDESGGLDFFDFLCFQNSFAAGEKYADCDASGGLDFFDFLCFQNEFAAGCGGGGLTLQEYGTEAPPSSDCGVRLTAFPADGRPDFTLVNEVPSPLGGDVTFSIPMSKRTIPGSWGSWSHGYNGSLYYTEGLADVTMVLPSNSAFYFYVEPNPFALIEFEITGAGAGDEVSVTDSIEGLSGAKGFGFCGGVEKINVRTTDGVTDFAVGEFGIAN